MVEVGTTDIAQFNPFEVIADACRLAAPRLRGVFEHIRPVDGRAIPDEDDLSRASCVRAHAKRAHHRFGIIGGGAYLPDANFESVTGWPNFDGPIDREHVELYEDNSFFMRRREVV
jgi:hypothetical protein